MRARRVPLTVLVIAGAGMSLGLYGCISERGGVTGPVAGGECRVPVTSPAVGTVLVAVQNFTFLPGDLRVKRGTTVTWVNCEPAGIDPHSTTSDVGRWDSGTVSPGNTFSVTFDESGTFTYHCVPHPFMRATVIVE
ncbi:MAG TPA: plastocyanin/azurin family copper-binding protein [Gemmatimonadaceae bacterium]|nr:plastocyanin/azurin family copper-binding protein [Gemmatimonadaceae bacterium]